MSTTESPEDARRWEEAMALAAGVDDPARRRSRRNRTFLLLAAAIAGSWVVGIVLALALPSPAGGAAGDLPDSRAVAALVVEGVGIVAAVIGFVWAVRTGRYVVRWRSIASPLSRGQRRLAQRAIAGKARLGAERTPFLIALAAQNRRSTEGITPLYGGLVLLDSASLLLHTRPVLLALGAVVVVLFAVAGVQLAVVYRRSGRFLAQHD